MSSNRDKLIDGAVLGSCMGLGHEAIRKGRDNKSLADGLLSGLVLGVVVQGVRILADKAGLTEKVNDAKDKILKR